MNTNSWRRDLSVIQDDNFAQQPMHSPRDFIIVGGFVAKTGKEDASILCAQIRAVSTSQQPGNKWTEQNLSFTETGALKLTHVVCWEDVDIFRRYLVSDESVNFFQDSLDLAVPQSYFIEQFTRIYNPLRKAETRRKSVTKADMFNPLNPIPQAFSVIVRLRPNMEKRLEFMQALLASEACAAYEDDCLRYDILQQWDDENDFMIYAVFGTEESYILHQTNSYCMIGPRAKHLCQDPPTITTYMRNRMSFLL